MFNECQISAVLVVKSMGPGPIVSIHIWAPPLTGRMALGKLFDSVSLLKVVIITPTLRSCYED